jgi:hypothetical protein
MPGSPMEASGRTMNRLSAYGRRLPGLVSCESSQVSTAFAPSIRGEARQARVNASCAKVTVHAPPTEAVQLKKTTTMRDYYQMKRLVAGWSRSPTAIAILTRTQYSDHSRFRVRWVVLDNSAQPRAAVPHDKALRI